MRFLGIILRVLRLKVSVYNVYITNQFQATFAQRGGVSRGDCEKQGGKLLRLCPNYVQEFGLCILLYIYTKVLTTKKTKVLLSLELLIFSLAKQTYMAIGQSMGSGGGG